MVRAFAAIALPDRQREALATYLARCAAVAPGFRWVAPESLHVTLRFAGNLDDAVAERLAESLAGVRAPAFAARLGGPGTFGGPRPSVVWLALAEGAEAAAALAAECERACQAAGLEPEARTFRPHLTLARARDRRGAPPVALPPAPELEAWPVREFVLYRSQLQGGRPPVYTPLRRYRLLEA